MRHSTRSIALIAALSLASTLIQAEPAPAHAHAVPPFLDSFGLNLPQRPVAQRELNVPRPDRERPLPATDSFGLNHTLTSTQGSCQTAGGKLPSGDGKSLLRCIEI